MNVNFFIFIIYLIQMGINRRRSSGGGYRDASPSLNPHLNGFIFDSVHLF